MLDAAARGELRAHRHGGLVDHRSRRSSSTGRCGTTVTRTSASSCRPTCGAPTDDLPGLDNVRLCKGIYVEPDEIAFQDVDEVRANFVRCLEALVAAGAYVGIATHDEQLIGEALRIVRERAAAGALRVPDAARRATGPRGRARRGGHRLRVYVPYGTHWYEYSVRRLQENPKLAGYVAADTLRRALGR